MKANILKILPIAGAALTGALAVLVALGVLSEEQRVALEDAIQAIVAALTPAA